jgi:hypothetical protein
MVSGDDKHWAADLDDEAIRRRGQTSFHVFAEGKHSDVRGQLYNLEAGSSLVLPSDRWQHHIFIVLGVRGNLQAVIASTTINVRPLSQVVVLPGVSCTLSALSDAAIELISFRSTGARSPTTSTTPTPPHAAPAVRIAAAANVLVPAIRSLELRGFDVTREQGGATELWRARRADLDLRGADPLELLALVALFESRGPNWQASESEIADVMRRFDLA